MTIAELIKRLRELQRQHGDLVVVMDNLAQGDPQVISATLYRCDGRTEQQILLSDRKL